MREFEYPIKPLNFGLREKTHKELMERLVNLEPYPFGLRNFEPLRTLFCWDFEGSPTAVFENTFPRDDSQRNIFLTKRSAFDLGPIAITNISLGLEAVPWQAWYDDQNQVWLRRTNLARTGWETAQLLVTVPGNPIEHLSLTWDQQGQPWVVFTQDGWVKLWWYDTVIQGYALVAIIEGAHYPLIFLDERRQPFIGDSDVLMFFWHNNRLRYAVQRERFLQFHDFASPIASPEDIRLELIARTDCRRIAVYYSTAQTCGAVIGAAATNPYPYYEIERLRYSFPQLSNIAIQETYYHTYDNAVEKFNYGIPQALSLNIEYASYTEYTEEPQALTYGIPQALDISIEYGAYIEYDGSGAGAEQFQYSFPVVTELDIEYAGNIAYGPDGDSLSFSFPSVTQIIIEEL